MCDINVLTHFVLHPSGWFFLFSIAFVILLSVPPNLEVNAVRLYLIPLLHVKNDLLLRTHFYFLMLFFSFCFLKLNIIFFSYLAKELQSLKAFWKKKSIFLLTTSQVFSDFIPQPYISFKQISVFCGYFTEKECMFLILEYFKGCLSGRGLPAQLHEPLQFFHCWNSGDPRRPCHLKSQCGVVVGGTRYVARLCEFKPSSTFSCVNLDEVTYPLCLSFLSLKWGQ